MRKKKHAEHVNHERWLVSYADFITLLFAFFVVMFAVSQVDSNKVGRFSEAFSKAVGVDVFPMTGDSLVTGGKAPDEAPAPAHAEEAKAQLEKLGAELSELVRNNEALQGLQVVRMRHELVLRLPESVMFDPGDASAKAAAIRMLAVVTPELARREVEVRVEGHTDDRPVSSGRFPSNWELSTARAMAVANVLMRAGLQPGRASVAGYGEYRPIAPNDGEEGRRQNRRVDLVVTALPVQPDAPK